MFPAVFSNALLCSKPSTIGFEIFEIEHQTAVDINSTINSFSQECKLETICLS